MCTIAQLNNIAERMVALYRNIYGSSIVSILLYGSYSRGDYSDASDIDIVAIVKGNRKELQKKLKTLWEYSSDISLENDVIVSPTVIPHDEFEKYKNVLPYYINIAREGRKIG